MECRPSIVFSHTQEPDVQVRSPCFADGAALSNLNYTKFSLRRTSGAPQYCLCHRALIGNIRIVPGSRLKHFSREGWCITQDDNKQSTLKYFHLPPFSFSSPRSASLGSSKPLSMGEGELSVLRDESPNNGW